MVYGEGSYVNKLRMSQDVRNFSHRRGKGFSSPPRTVSKWMVTPSKTDDSERVSSGTKREHAREVLDKSRVKTLELQAHFQRAAPSPIKRNQSDIDALEKDESFRAKYLNEEIREKIEQVDSLEASGHSRKDTVKQKLI